MFKNTQSGKLGKYFQESWRLRKVAMLDKILKNLETKIKLIHMFTCYKLLLILELIPIWVSVMLILENGFHVIKRETLTKNEILETE